MGRVGSSPHARGLPGDGPGGRGRLRIIPACAGFTRRERGRPSDRGIIPACAGFTRTPVRRHGCARDHPRMRGVYPTTCPSSASRGGSSPHARGLRGLPFPNELALMDHPRMRGVYTTGTLAPALQSGSSPHARGLRLDHHDLVHDCRIIPACAGFTSRAPRSPAPGWDHPRMRGVYRVASADCVGVVGIIPACAGFTAHPPPRGPLRRGSSPHARGLRYVSCPAGESDRIIPACAGFTENPGPYGVGVQDHPRMRGVYRRRAAGRPCGRGSSPHARGLREPPPMLREALRIIPACAGFTRSSRRRWWAAWDHPRMCGVYGGCRAPSSPPRGSSPHARGLPQAGSGEAMRPGIIPACAGFTLVGAARAVCAADHPRMRGVYYSPPGDRQRPLGSSPHARGLLPVVLADGGAIRIIPACAGFTPA